MAYRLPDDDDQADSPATSQAAVRRRRRASRRRRAALRSIAVLPTLCTLGNALCGFLSIFFASRSADTTLPWDWTPLTFGAIFIFVGMLFDALDGRIARLTGHTSDLGGQLDSMADMVTCGVAPAFLAVQLAGVETPFLSDAGDRLFDRAALMVASIYVACAALRLARFNLENVSADVSDHMSFKGLPSPGAAGTVASLVLLHEHHLAKHMRAAADGAATPTLSGPMRLDAVIMVAVTLLVGLAMVSRFRYSHVTNRYIRGRAPIGTITKGVVIMLLVTIALQEVIAAGFVIYALSAPVLWTWRYVLQRFFPDYAARRLALSSNGSRHDENADGDDIHTDRD